MAAISQPGQQDNSKAFTLIGAGVGAAYGNPMAGAAAGQMAGGLTASAPTPAIQESSGAMSRRLGSMDQQQDPLLQLRDAQTSLATMPPHIQEQYAPALNAAYMQEQQRRGMA